MAVNNTGSEKYWFNGLPAGTEETANDTGTFKYWFNGLPNGTVFPATATVSVPLMTMMGVQ